MAFNKRAFGSCVAIYSVEGIHTYAFGTCLRARQSYAALNMFDRRDNQVLDFGAGDAAPRSRWRIELDAVVDGAKVRRAANVRADANGTIQHRVKIAGDVTSRVRAVATARDGERRCLFTYSRDVSDLPLRG
jgi:hypothetical protein